MKNVLTQPYLSLLWESNKEGVPILDTRHSCLCFFLNSFHISKLMSGKSKNAKKTDLKQSYFFNDV